MYICKILLISSTTHQKTYRYKQVQTYALICRYQSKHKTETRSNPTVHLHVKTEQNVFLPPHDCDFWVVFVTPSRLFQDSVLMVMLPLVTGDKVLIS